MNEREGGMISTYYRLKRQRDAGEIESGFTLIELLIVIVVLGILAAVVVFSLGGVTGKSAIAACQADGATVSTAMAVFNTQNPGTTPTQALLTGTTSGGPYIQSWPSNSSHFAFAVATAVGTPTGATAIGQLVVSVSPAGAVTGAGTFIPYVSSSSCIGVS